MKFTYNWLKDFVDIKISPQMLADKLTMAGLEVTSLEEKEGDFVFEVEITSNRPDWLSVVGIAREVAAITGKKLASVPVCQLSSLSRQTGKPVNRLTLNIEDRKDCSLYTATIINDVKVGPSPDWLKKRLELIDCRSVNNIVDITNYVLFETGEPLHAFDLDKIVSLLASEPVNRLEIIVKRALKNEEIITIDGIKRILDENILIIASNINQQTGKPIALAGIMGGKDTEVTENTKNILLEAAIFSPILIRRARQKLALQSESAYRFERGIDSATVEKASSRAATLINELAGGNTVLIKSAGKTQVKRKTIILDVADVSRILGVNITMVKIKKILTGLDFKVCPVKNSKSLKKQLEVTVPSHRSDVNLSEDLIEEISRIFGYENIPVSLPKISLARNEICPKPNLYGTRGIISLVKNILVGLGLNEVITYSLIDKDLLRDFNINTETIEILNPLSKEQEILRPVILPSLTKTIAYNLNQKQESISIFEITKIFSKTQNQPKEELTLGIGLCGTRPLLLEQGLIKNEFSFLHLKGVLEVLFERLGIQEYDFNTESESSISVNICKEKIGLITNLSKEALEQAGIKNKKAWVSQISLEKIFKYVNLTKKFLSPPKYPGITRDISFILKTDIEINTVLKAMRESNFTLLRSIRIVDYYKGPQIPADYRSLTISCLYRSDERTLTEEEINPLHAEIRNILSGRFSAKIR